MFSANGQTAGFGIKLDNGFHVSVQWGPGNYHDRRDYTPNAWSNHTKRYQEVGQQSPNAEIMVTSPSDITVQIDGDDVRGYTTPDELAKLLAHLSKRSQFDTRPIDMEKLP